MHDPVYRSGCRHREAREHKDVRSSFVQHRGCLPEALLKLFDHSLRLGVYLLR